MPTTKSQPPIFEILTTSGPGTPSTQDKLRVVSEMRRDQPEITSQLDRFLIEQAAGSRAEARETKAYVKELESVVEQLTAPPQIAAIYLGPVQTPGGGEAVVVHNNARRVVPLAGTVDRTQLKVGDEVLLNQDLSVLVARSPVAGGTCGETAHFDRMLSGDRMLVRSHDDQIAIGMKAALREETWEQGDLVRWNRSAWLAFEKIERAQSNEFMIETVPQVPPDQVGGQRGVLRELISTLTIMLTRPDLAAMYELQDQPAVLLVGPPGTGKTLMARVAASEVRRLTGNECRICVVRPGQFEDPYVGMTQRRIRECFEAARRCDGYVLMFLDEIESIGRHRGGPVGQHHDKFLAAFLAEAQGFHTDEGRKIAIVAATNRLDLLDAALVDRLGVQLQVPRPDRRGAEEIFSIHLGERLPYHPDGDGAPATRAALIERAVCRFYSPNADNAICTVRFRDSAQPQRVVTARELASGRCFEQVCRAARRRACFREVGGGQRGVGLDDMDDALAETIEKMSATLTRHNVRNYLADLPQDQDVVAVEPVVRRVSRPHRYQSGG